MRFKLLFLAFTFFISCVSTNTQSLSDFRPPHHTADGKFDNTDTVGGILRDTVRPDSLVNSYRTKVYPLPIVRGNERLWFDSSIVTATWIGHATYYLRWKNVGILFDPIFSNRASPSPFFGPKRGTPPGRSLEDLPSVDLVVISHDHYDHLDAPSIKRIYEINPAVMFAVPLKVKGILIDWGIPSDQIFEKDWWDEFTWRGFRIVCVPAHHTSRRGMFASSAKSTLWAGWILERDEKKVWFAGDIGMGNGDYYREIAARESPFDLAMIPIGSYLPARYTSVHISPNQAAQLHLLVKSRLSLAMHWGDFGMVYEELEDPPKDLDAALKKYDIDPDDFRVLKHGEIVKVFSTLP